MYGAWQRVTAESVLRYRSMTLYEQLPDDIQRQLSSIAEEGEFDPLPDLLERLADNWLKKRSLIDAQCAALHMEQVDDFGGDDPRGLIAVTRSGSMIVLGPLSAQNAPGERPTGAGGRWLEYASIKLRQDVPRIVKATGVSIADRARVDQTLALSQSPVERTSELMSIATFDPQLSGPEQDRRLREASIFLTNGFLKLNNEVSVTGDVPAHFTMKAIVDYVAAKNDMTQGAAKQIVDDFLTTVESGMLLGERVGLGRIGRLSLSVRSAQKARVGRNPQTGEETLIAAKPQRSVPKMTFSKRLRERVERISPAESGEQDSTQ